MRQSKDDVEVGHGKQVLLAPREPALARLGLTLRAVPVAARVFMVRAPQRCMKIDPPGGIRGRITLASRSRARVWSRTHVKHNALLPLDGEHAKEILAVAAFGTRPVRRALWM